MERTSNEWFNQWALQTHFSIGKNETQQASFSHRYWLRSRRHFNQSAQRASAGCCRMSFQTPLRNPWALNVMNIATTKTHTPTHTHLPTATMPDSRLPDISLQMLFSMSRPHIFWYSWKTRRATGEGEHQWPGWTGLRRKKQGISADLHGGEACCEHTGWHWTGTRPFPLCFRQQSKVSVGQTDVQN